MLGAVILVLVLVAIPIGFLVSTTVAAGVIGALLQNGAEGNGADPGTTDPD